jgi:hypothetical protein
MHLGFFIGCIPYPADLALNLLGARLFYSPNLDGIASSLTRFGIDLCIARIAWPFDFIATLHPIRWALAAKFLQWGQ